MMSKKTAEVAWMHSFERAMLGKAPFKCVGYDRKTYQAAPEAPLQPGGHCEFCGAGLMNVFTIESSDGRLFTVGPDCVERTGDTELIEATRKADKAWRRAQREAAWRETNAARKAERDATEAAQALENRRHGSALIQRLTNATDARFAPYKSRQMVTKAAQDMIEGKRTLDTSEDEDRALEECERYAALPAPRHFPGAAPGERIVNARAVYLGGPTFETAYGLKMMAKFIIKDGPNAGALMVWPSTSYPRTDWIGREVTISATVKEHTAYQDVPQTTVTRCKVTE